MNESDNISKKTICTNEGKTVSLEIARVAVKAAQEKKANNIVVLDLRGRSDVCDYQIVCSGDSERQAMAIAESIEQLCKASMNILPFAIEGKTSGHWISMDYGSIIIHVFLKSLRDYYAIESLWPNASLGI
jgi:ribosome-associated protein